MTGWSSIETVGELLGFLVSGVIVACFLVLVTYAVFLVGAASATVRDAHHDRLLHEDLDRVLEEVLGPRSDQQRSV
jgi:cell division protein FtsL